MIWVGGSPKVRGISIVAGADSEYQQSGSIVSSDSDPSLALPSLTSHDPTMKRSVDFSLLLALVNSTLITVTTLDVPAIGVPELQLRQMPSTSN